MAIVAEKVLPGRRGQKDHLHGENSSDFMAYFATKKHVAINGGLAGMCGFLLHQAPEQAEDVLF